MKEKDCIGANPDVTVLMALNKCGPYFDEALQSIFNQTLQSFELVLVANAIDDKDWARLEELAQKDARVSVYRLVMPGLANALNFGLEKVHTEFVARMDADDICAPERLALQLRRMKEVPNLVVLGGRVDLIDENGHVLRKFPCIQRNDQIRSRLPLRNCMVHPALMFRRLALLEVGGYRYGHSFEDHELLLRLMRHPNNQFENLDRKVLGYRRHPDQITHLGNARRNFAEISGFLFTEFLLTLNLKFLIGMAIVSPWARSLAQRIRQVKSIIKA